jgi:hypothetical protein
MNTSEVLAIRALELASASVRKLPPRSRSGSQTPDLEIAIGDVRIIAEVKEICENPEEEKILRKVENRELVSFNQYGDHQRIAKAITDANKQLKAKCDGDLPGLVILFDARDFLTRNIAPQQFLLQAMFGREVIWRTVPHPASPGPSRTTAHRFGGGRAITTGSNTTTSAIGWLLVAPNNTTTLLLHHNPFARIPFPRRLFGRPVREFEISDTHNFSSFAEI